MSSHYEKEEIEKLQRALASWESLARDARKKIKKLLSDKESRRCQIEIMWDELEGMYLTRYVREEKVLYFAKSKKYARYHASIGIESVDGKDPRVPWKQIDMGKPWIVSAILDHWFWEKYVDSDALPPSKIISIETFKALRARPMN